MVQFLEGKECSRLGEVKESRAAKPSKGCGGGGPKVGGEGSGGGSAILGGVPALYLLLRFQSIAAGGTRLSKALVNACTVSRDPGLAPRWAQGTRKVAQRQPLLPDIQIQLSKFAGDTTVVALRRKAEFTKSDKPYHVQSQFISKLTVPFWLSNSNIPK